MRGAELGPEPGGPLLPEAHLAGGYCGQHCSSILDLEPLTGGPGSCSLCLCDQVQGLALCKHSAKICRTALAVDAPLVSGAVPPAVPSSLPLSQGNCPLAPLLA